MQKAWQPKSRLLCGRMESVGVWLDMSQTKQPTTPPSSATSSRASSFFPPTSPFFLCLSCISQDQLSAPGRTAGPSFAASRHGSGLLLRSATSRVSFYCGNLGLRSPPSASFYAGGRTRLVPRFRARNDDGLSVCCMEPKSSFRARGTDSNFSLRNPVAGTCRHFRHLQADCPWTSQSSIRLPCVAGCCRQSEMTGILTGVAGSPK